MSNRPANVGARHLVELTQAIRTGATKDDIIGGCDLLAAELEELLEFHPIDLAIVEGYGFSKYSAEVGVSVGACVRLTLHRACIPWIDVPPKSLKTWTTGDGKATKPAMARAVERRFGVTAKTTDEIDATALAMFGHAAFGRPPTDVDSAQRDAVAKVLGGQRRQRELCTAALKSISRRG